MDIAELVEIALANVDRNRVEATELEPANVAVEGVGGLTQLIAELVDNALAFSDPDERVRISGVFEGDSYLIQITDSGVGIPAPMLEALNEVLSDPGSPSQSLGIVVVARLAARNGVDVRLMPAASGTKVRISVPGQLMSPQPSHDNAPSGEADETSIDIEDLPESIHPGHVVAMSASARRTAEAFLERVFGPLQESSPPSRPAGKPKLKGHNGHATTATTVQGPPGDGLQRRVPGRNFSVSEDDPSTASGEGAIDIRLNLDRYDEGRRAASEGEGDQP